MHYRTIRVIDCNNARWKPEINVIVVILHRGIKLKANHMIWSDINVKLRGLWETCLSVTPDLKLQEIFTGVASIMLTRSVQLLLHKKEMHYFLGSVAFGILQHRGCIRKIRCQQMSDIAVTLSFWFTLIFFMLLLVSSSLILAFRHFFLNCLWA